MRSLTSVECGRSELLIALSTAGKIERDTRDEWTGYVYVDPRCPRVIYGKPTFKFMRRVVEDFVQIATRRISHQNCSTASESFAFSGFSLTRTT